ncbi:MAG: ribosome maturation factor RimP [Micropruina sp.]|uniref:ribosome maturation factor RimP n=1 Tax=Micropruina sp. TaxID=2737536 RepID=UPI0039E3E20E
MDSTTISDLVTPVVAPRGLEVDRVEVIAAGNRRVVQIYLDGDGPQGRGPSLDEIADATRAISRVLDDAPALGKRPWTLEVSSRGVSRPLTAARHFRRNTGRLIAASTDDGAITGRILGATETEVTLDIDGSSRTLPIDSLTRAVVQVELNRSIDDEGQ